MTNPAWRIAQTEYERPYGKGLLVVACERGCRIPLSPQPVQKGDTKRWGWDGNVEKPTITPSVNCDGMGGCGWHAVITGGVTNVC